METGFASGDPTQQSWKVTLPCTRAEAETLSEDIGPFAFLDTPPTIVTSEADATKPDDWRVDAYFEGKPDRGSIETLRRLVPSAARAEPVLKKIDDGDWVALSQQGLEPIREGRLFVHTARHRDEIPAGALAFEIDASRAFGTGQHETTSGCLAMLDREKSCGRRFTNICDLGTGTGLLAFAALALWPRARAIASDIDPLAIAIAEENAAINDIPLGRGAGQLELATAAGLAHRRLKARAPYDCIVANILAKPLIDLAKPIARAASPGGTLILAGLRNHQAESVMRAYRRQRFRATDRIDRNEWTILKLRKRTRFR